MVGRFRKVGVTAALLAAVSLAACTPASRLDPDEDGESSPPATLQTVSQQIDADWQAFSDQYPDVQRPVVDIVRVVGLEDWATTIAACMGDQGFAVSVSRDNGLEWESLPVAQAESFALAQFICSATYPLNPKVNVPLDDEQLARLYDYFVNELTPCLEGEGFAVGDAPSLQAFTDDYYSERSWSPYDAVVSQQSSEDDWYEVNEKCPQALDSLYG